MKILLKSISAITAIIFLFSACTYEVNYKEPASEQTNSPEEAEESTVSLYFNNTRENPDAQDCSAVFPVSRVIKNDANLEEKIKLTVNELLLGPNPSEQNQFYNSFFSEVTGRMLHEIKVEGSTAYIDFEGGIKTLIPNATTSCGSQQFFSSVENTVTQFEGIEKVLYKLDGNPAEFYRWMQLVCPEGYEQCVMNAG